MQHFTKDQPLFYIIMRNHNAFHLTSESLSSLKQLTYPNYHIIVVDDGSTDDSAAKIEGHFPDITVIRTGRYLEYCKSFNVGVRKALEDGAEYVFLVNNDTKDFSPNYVEEIVKAFESNEKIGLAGSCVYDYSGRPLWQGTAKNKLGVPMETPTEGFVVKREVFEKIGLLNERLVRYFEDLDFIIRLRKAGYETRSVTTVSFAHLCGGTSKKQKFIPNYYRVRNVTLFLKRYCKDKSFRWKTTKFLACLRVHTDRLEKSLRQGNLKAFTQVGGSIVLGFIAGLILPWRD